VIGWDPVYIREGLLRWKEKRMLPAAGAKIYQFNPRVPAKKLIGVSVPSDQRPLKKSVG
jgi:hypothetical protein